MLIISPVNEHSLTICWLMNKRSFFDDYRRDESLKGEFIRTVEAAENLSDEEKAAIIKLGIGALKGEEAE